MSCEPVIQVQAVSKRFRVYQRQRDRLLELCTGRCRHKDFVALETLSFALERGETLGIIGENGSGKSTLLKLVAGVLQPDAGQIITKGKITGLLELGTGFNAEMSGRKNIYLNGTYLNMSPNQIKEREKAIIAFAELEYCIDEPLKNYSSGMAMRLAFAIAIHADPECFLIDEALSVGDIRFQQKCFERLREFRKKEGTILFVSHDMNAIKLLCSKAMLLHHGQMLYLGEPDATVNVYNEMLAVRGHSGTKTPTGYGNNALRFSKVQIVDQKGQEVQVLTSGEPMVVQFSYICNVPVENVSFGLMIRDRFGQDVFGSNGALLGKQAYIQKNGQGCFRFPALNIGPGQYTINLAAHTGTTHLENCFHWWDNAATFEVVQDVHYLFSGHTRLAVDLELQDGYNGTF